MFIGVRVAQSFVFFISKFSLKKLVSEYENSKNKNKSKKIGH
jgi:hypothetical protein